MAKKKKAAKPAAKMSPKKKGAKSAKKSQVVAIDDALEQMHRECEHEKQPLVGDRLFHLRIAEATGNGALVAVVKMKEEERKKLLAYLDQQRKEAARKEQEFAAFLKTKKKEEKNRRTAWEREMMRDELQLENEGIAVNWREEQEEIQRRMEEERESGERGEIERG